MIKETEQLKVVIADTREELGSKAAEAAYTKINELLETKETINMIFAAAPSQNEFLASLLTKNIDWSRINAFHMDEYVGLAVDAPQGFGNFLRDKIFDKVPFKSVNFLDGQAEDKEEACKRYAELLENNPVDIVCMGIGENAHIAFNDPHVADFNDPKLVKIVDLDELCRIQQVNDGCFAQVDDVPTHALTLTVTALVKAPYIFCMVPGEKKANAVYHTLNADITEKYPSTILRKHPEAILFIDQQSSALLSKD
jgi:glucosamine-6-phosphate deaminase